MRRLLRSAVWGLAAVLLVAAGTVFVASRAMTLQWVAQQATRFTGGKLQIEGITGSALSEVAADSLRWQGADVAVTLISPRFTYHPLALLDGLVRVERISATDVLVELPPAPASTKAGEPLRLPQSLAAVLPAAVERVDAARVVVRRAGTEVLELRNLEAVFRHDGDRFNASLLNVDVVAGDYTTVIRGEVAVLARAPYATDGRFAVRMPAQAQALRVDLRFSGPLEELAVRASTAVAGAPVEARTILYPLDPRPLRRVRVDLKDFDASRYDPALPATRLTGSYEAEVMPAWANDSKPLLIGPLNLVNSLAGPLDRKRLPVAAAKAVVGYLGGRIEVQGLQVSGPLGEVAGDGWIGRDSFRLALASDRLLLRGIDSTLAPRTLSARVAVEPTGSEAAAATGPAGARTGLADAMRLEVTASDASLAAEVRGVVTGRRLQISLARLQSKPGARGGAGQAAFHGTLDVGAPWPVDLSGEFTDFEPAQLVKMPDALLNGTWQVSGRAGGADGGRLKTAVALTGSRLRGLPLAGRLAADLTLGEQSLRRLSAVDAALSWGSGTLTASGALGDPEDALRLVLDLPKADDVLDGTTGALTAAATLRGGLQDPGIEATLDGSRLTATFDGVRTTIGAAAVQLRSATVRSGLLDVQSRLDDVAVARVAKGGYAMTASAGGLLRFDRVSATVSGSHAGHDLDLNATGSDQRVTLSAKGGLDEGGSWRGVVREFSASHPWLKWPIGAAVGPNSGLPAAAATQDLASLEPAAAGNDDLRSLQPFVVTAGAGRASARDADFDFQGARLNLKQADWRESVLTLSADAEGLPLRWLGRLVNLEALGGHSADRGGGAAVDGLADRSLPHDLRLAAALDFTGDLADSSAAGWRGRLEVRRESGDLWLQGPDGEVGAGLRTLQASAVLDSRSLGVVVNIDGENIGRLGGEANTTLQGSSRPLWTEDALARSPLAGTIDMATTSFRWISPLVGGSWSVDGALSARLLLAGTLARPRADGFVTGSNLSAEEPTLGMRLANGVLAAELAAGRIDVKVLRFESAEGSVAISGLLQPPGNGGSEAHVAIDRLPIPLGPGQRVVLSGSTTATLQERSLDITGRLVADEGSIELTAGDGFGDSGDLAIGLGTGRNGLAVRAALPDSSVGSSIRRTRAVAGDSSTPGSGAGSLSTGGGTGSGSVGRSSSSATSSDADGTSGSGTRAGAPGAEGETAEGGPATQGQRPFGVDTDIRIDLGRHFQVSGSGLEGRLKGAIRLRSSFPELPSASGIVDLVDGTYQVHGRRLKARRGRLVFDGPLDDPTLDIVAVREHLRVEPGLAIGGTALAPVAGLVSNPEVADADKLAWLVLGSGLQDVQGLSQMLALQAAAATLFGEDGSHYALAFAARGGADRFSVREHDAGAGRPAAGASEMTHGAAASLGWRLSSRLYAACEQSLRGVWNILKLQYEITDRLSLSVRAGSERAADLLGFYPFD